MPLGAAGPRQADDHRVPEPAVADAAHRVEAADDPGARRRAVHPERDRALALDPEQLLAQATTGTRAGGVSSAWTVSSRRASKRASTSGQVARRAAATRRGAHRFERAAGRGQRSRPAAMKAASSPGATRRPLTPSATCSAAAATSNDDHRQAGGERLHDDVAEGVGQAREQEQVGRRVVRRQVGAALHADEARVGIAPLAGALAPGRRRRRPGAGRGGSRRACSNARRPSSTFFSAATRPTISSTGAVRPATRARSAALRARRREALGVDAAADDRQVVEAGGAELARASRASARRCARVRLWKRRSRPSTGAAKRPRP